MEPKGNTNQNLVGAVLAGGPGLRIGGGKPWRTVGGQRLIDRALTTISSVCPEVVIVTGDVAAMAGFPYRIIADRWPGQGPLAALATVMLEMDVEDVMVMAVDMPFVNRDLIRLIVERTPGAKAVAPLGPRGPEPLLSRYNRSCLPNIMRLLEKGENRPRILLQSIKAEFISREEVRVVDPDGLSFLNVNYPEDLARADGLAQAKCGV